jgi:hypothetical protein
MKFVIGAMLLSLAGVASAQSWIQPPSGQVVTAPVPSTDGSKPGLIGPETGDPVTSTSHLDIPVFYVNDTPYDLLVVNAAEVSSFASGILIKAYRDNVLLGELLNETGAIQNAFINNGLTADFTASALTFADATVRDINRLEIYAVMRPQFAEATSSIFVQHVTAGTMAGTNSFTLGVNPLMWGPVETVTAVPEISTGLSTAMGLLAMVGLSGLRRTRRG